MSELFLYLQSDKGILFVGGALFIIALTFHWCRK